MYFWNIFNDILQLRCFLYFITKLFKSVTILQGQLPFSSLVFLERLCFEVDYDQKSKNVIQPFRCGLYLEAAYMQKKNDILIFNVECQKTSKYASNNEFDSKNSATSIKKILLYH